MNVSEQIKRYGLGKAFQYVYKNPDENLLKIIDWADFFCKRRI